MTCMTRMGELERTVMEVVWAGPDGVTGRQVADALAPRGLAYTTVLTVLGRLEAKGLLRKDSRARAHTWSAVTSREDHVSLLMQDALGQAGDRAVALQHFARAMDPAEAAALRRALDDLQ